MNYHINVKFLRDNRSNGPSILFWNYDNVILYPHSASTTYGENKKIINLFIKNIKLFIKNKPLINEFNKQYSY